MQHDVIDVREGADLTKKSIGAFRKWAQYHSLSRVPNVGRRTLYYRAEVLILLGVQSGLRLVRTS